MSAVAKFENLKDLIVELRGQSVLLDCDVAELYKVETKRVNEAVKNNPDKFPNDYMFEISEGEFAVLRSKFSTTKITKTRALPKAFTEKGLYMIATILKSKQATEATFAIIETFSKIRQLSRSIQELSIIQEKADQKALMQRSGELIASIFDEDLQTSDTETSIELNFAVLKFKHTIKKKKNEKNLHFHRYPRRASQTPARLPEVRRLRPDPIIILSGNWGPLYGIGGAARKLGSIV